MLLNVLRHLGHSPQQRIVWLQMAIVPSWESLSQTPFLYAMVFEGPLFPSAALALQL